MMALVDLAKNGHFPGALKARVQRERERGGGKRWAFSLRFVKTPKRFVRMMNS